MNKTYQIWAKRRGSKAVRGFKLMLVLAPDRRTAISRARKDIRQTIPVGEWPVITSVKIAKYPVK